MEQPKLWMLLQKRLVDLVGSGLTSELITDFCDCNDTTYRRWIANQTTATGWRSVRLWWLLAYAGSPSPELNELSDGVRLTGELLAFNVITMKEVLEILNVKTEQQAFRSLRGQTRPLRMMHSSTELMELYGNDLEAARDSLRKSLGRTGMTSSSIVGPKETSASKPKKSVTQSQPTDETKSETAQVESLTPAVNLMLASQLGAVLPLLRYVNSDQLSASQRSALRDMIGQETLFELSLEINSLQSERARSNRK